MVVPAGSALWTARGDAPWIDESVGQLLRGVARRSPEALAVIVMAEDASVRTVTWSQLLTDACRAARALLAMAAPGRAVALCAANSMDWVLLEYATALAGMVLVPLNPAMADAELGYILGLTDPAVVLSDDRYRDRPLYSDLEGLLPPGGGVLLRLTEWVRDAGGDGPLPEVQADDPLLVQYTSGTTGRPKGAVHTHRSALNCAALWAADWGHTSEDVFATPVPLHHVGGSVTGVLTGLATGSCIALLERYRPDLFLELLRSSGATVTAAVPTMLFDLQRQPGFDADALRPLRIIAGGGAAVPPSSILEIEDVLGATFVVVYGQSESPAILATPPAASVERRASSLGRPLPGRDVKILRSDGATAAFGEIGEIVTRSPVNMREYLGQPGETAAVIDPDGWLHTGDLGAMDHDGYVTFHGRLRDVIIRGGENLYAAEIEAVLHEHPAVAAVAVVGRPDPRLGEVPVAFVVGSGAAPLDAADLEAFAKLRLAAFKVPQEWHVVTNLPMTASGKIRKVELKARLTGEAGGDARQA